MNGNGAAVGSGRGPQGPRGLKSMERVYYREWRHVAVRKDRED